MEDTNNQQIGTPVEPKIESTPTADPDLVIKQKRDFTVGNILRIIAKVIVVWFAITEIIINIDFLLRLLEIKNLFSLGGLNWAGELFYLAPLSFSFVLILVILSIGFCLSVLFNLKASKNQSLSNGIKFCLIIVINIIVAWLFTYEIEKIGARLDNNVFTNNLQNQSLVILKDFFSLKSVFSIIIHITAFFWIYWKEKEILNTEKKWLADKIIFGIAGLIILVIFIFSVYGYTQSKQKNPFMAKLAKQVPYNVYGLKEDSSFRWKFIDMKESVISGALETKNSDFVSSDMIVLKEGSKGSFDKNLEDMKTGEEGQGREINNFNEKNIKGIESKNETSTRGFFIWNIDERTDIAIRGLIFNFNDEAKTTWRQTLEEIQNNLVPIN